jgi:energy-coupling factor transport system substrate-specific component
MRDLIAMWANTRMVVLTAMSASLYAAILIPFKVLPLIPGVTEFLRPMPFGGVLLPVRPAGPGGRRSEAQLAISAAGPRLFRFFSATSCTG